MNNVFLLVDDDSDDSELFGEAIQENNPEIAVHVATNGREAFNVLNEIEQPDLIFLDINMPIMNGWECLAKLKISAEYKNIPVIMYSTSSHKKDIDLAAETGAITFLSKPHDYQELRRILKSLTQHLENGTIDQIGPVLSAGA